ncbi:MAG TPA: cystathionine gamma-lyase [Burkholderiaceae bacterium]|nr:cystathionine gamma-lyase [Burkholderiaceae bacterium]
MPASDLETRFAAALHHGAAALKPGDPLSPPIVPTSVYYLPGDPAGPHQYGRWSNPTWDALEEALATLEDAETVLLPSGMATVAAIFYTQLKSGDRVLLPADGYYVTRALAEKFLAGFGVIVDTVATARLENTDLTGYRLVWIETPSNPGLDLADIEHVSARARAAGARVVVDNTTMSPLGQRPLELGADVVVSSDTKSVGGHSDVLSGHVSSRDAALMAQVRDWRKSAGAIPGSFEAWLVHRGLETLDVRFERMCASALLLAQRLAEHRSVKAVRYPGLPDHPAHALAQRQMCRFGSLIALTLADGAAAEAFIGGCRFVRAATSFGGVHTSAERRARWGDQVAPGFIRLSVGCEPCEVLWQDLRASLDRL